MHCLLVTSDIGKGKFISIHLLNIVFDRPYVWQTLSIFGEVGGFILVVEVFQNLLKVSLIMISYHILVVYIYVYE